MKKRHLKVVSEAGPGGQQRITLANQRVIPIYTELAEEIGLAESIVLVQLDFWIGLGASDPDKHFRDGRWWTYQSVRKMEEQIRVLPRSVLDRTIASLVSKGLIVVGNYNQRSGDRTRWFAINYDACDRLAACRGDRPAEGQEGAIGVPGWDGPVPLRDTPVPERDDVTREDPREDTGDTPLPPEGADGPPPIIEAVALPDPPERTRGEERTPPPAPAPSIRPDAEQRMLDAGRQLDRRSSGNGWSERPDELEQLKDRLWEKWRTKNPSRISRKDVARVPMSVAPDEADRFKRQTAAYLQATDDEYVMGLKRWLEEWRDWAEPRRQPQVTSSIRDEIELTSSMTGRKVV